ncbi:MAG: HPr kinase/phosphatase C-terminal domain-containing protein [Pseudomonadota bacterium]|nr:HPr kinase/phosphatase C-terminal domain-containing protein [Pseudomonadota bacterium]
MWVGMERVHGTCVAIDGAGVLLRGPSGGGKSDLALRLIDGGATLVCDDQLELSRVQDRVVARAPGPLQGQLEIRGIGIVAVEAVAQAPLALVVDLIPADQVIRFPDPAVCHYLGLAIPLLALAAFEASTPAKIIFALRNPEALR